MNQNISLFIKRKFGIFKHSDVVNRRVKNQLSLLLGSLRANAAPVDTASTKRPKLIFSKKLNKLFFRSGRQLLLTVVKLKKYTIQKNISKRFTNSLKHSWLHQANKTSLDTILIKTNIFYTHKDSQFFIKHFGVLYKTKILYKFTECISVNIPFYITWCKNQLVFYIKKRSKIILNIKNIKFYKFRSKIFITSFKTAWIPSADWINEHSFLYVFRSANVEFDIRTFSGLILYDYNNLSTHNLLSTINLSLYMSRSYNWKYIT